MFEGAPFSIGDRHSRWLAKSGDAHPGQYREGTPLMSGVPHTPQNCALRRVALVIDFDLATLGETARWDRSVNEETGIVGVAHAERAR